MTIGLAVTILLAILDHTGKVNLSLFQIFIPMIVEFSFYAIIWLLIIFGAIKVGAKTNRDRKKAARARQARVRRR